MVVVNILISLNKIGIKNGLTQFADPWADPAPEGSRRPCSLSLSEAYAKPLLDSGAASTPVLPGRKVQLRVMTLSGIMGVIWVNLATVSFPKKCSLMCALEPEQTICFSSWTPSCCPLHPRSTPPSQPGL